MEFDFKKIFPINHCHIFSEPNIPTFHYSNCEAKFCVFLLLTERPLWLWEWDVDENFKGGRHDETVYVSRFGGGGRDLFRRWTGQRREI
jgi:hypothetical protein